MKNLNKFLIATIMLSASSVSFASKASKAMHQKLKKECLAENGKLKGKKLKACIKEKKAALNNAQ